MRSSKIVKIGNSTGFIIPKRITSYLDWNLGDRVYLNYDKEAGAVIIKKVPSKKIISK